MNEVNADRRASLNQRRRVRRTGVSRPCRIAISVDEAERLNLEDAARSEGLTVSAFVAEKAIAAAHNGIAPVAGPFREALVELARATIQVQKVGVNLNQSVAALNATGEAPENLIQYARYATAVIDRLDQIAVEIKQRLP